MRRSPYSSAAKLPSRARCSARVARSAASSSMIRIKLYGLSRKLFDQRFSTFGTLYSLEIVSTLNLGLTNPRT